MFQAPDMEASESNKISERPANVKVEALSSSEAAPEVVPPAVVTETSNASKQPSNVKTEASSSSEAAPPVVTPAVLAETCKTGKQPSNVNTVALAYSEAASEVVPPSVVAGTCKIRKQPLNVKTEASSSSQAAPAVVGPEVVPPAVVAAAADREDPENSKRRQRVKGKAKAASSSGTVDMEAPESSKRRRKRSKGKEAASSSTAAVVAAPLQQDVAVVEPLGRWPELPEELLAIIVDLLRSLRDVTATASVCGPWRTFVRSSPQLAGRPPLLVRPVVRYGEPDPNRRRRRGRRVPWISPRRCEIICPAAGPMAPPRRAPVSAETLDHKFLGVAHGHIIFKTDNGRHIIVLDPFSGVEVRPPLLPDNNGVASTLATLTVPISSPDCKLILSAGSSVFYLWGVGDENWTVHSLRAAEVMSSGITLFWDIIKFKDQIFAFDIDSRLFQVSFSSEFIVQQLPLRWEGGGPSGMINGNQFLVECADELMLVQAAPTVVTVLWTFNVFRLDLSSDPPMWRKVRNLGDWSLFVDSRSAVACESPRRWGGRANCIYYIGRGCHTWYVFPLGVGAVMNVVNPNGPFHHTKAELPLWPSGLWIYPSHF